MRYAIRKLKITVVKTELKQYTFTWRCNNSYVGVYAFMHLIYTTCLT